MDRVMLIASTCLFGLVALALSFVRGSGLGKRRRLKDLHTNGNKTVASTRGRLLVVLGSGGHTAEMMAILQEVMVGELRTDFQDGIEYVVAITDSHSSQKAKAAHELLGLAQPRIIRTPRAREVGQSWLSSIWTTAIAATFALRVVARSRPSILLINGPGTCVPIALCCLFFNSLGASRTQIVYVESVARVSSLSLSGKILYPISHRFLVQWPQLLEKYGAAEYYGRLI